MGVYVRRSKSFGLLRLNASKSGLGFSVGVKGARVGMTPHGQKYVRGGRDGVYFRKTLGTAAGGSRTRQSGGSSSAALAPAHEPVMHSTVGASAETLAKSGEAGSYVAQFRKTHRARKAVFLLALLSLSLVAVSVAFVAVPVLLLVVSRSLKTKLTYKMDATSTERYGVLVSAYAGILASKGAWLVSGEGNNDAFKARRSGGASINLSTEKVSASLKGPKTVKLNVKPPTLSTGSQTVAFLPDQLLVKHRAHYATIPYSDLSVSTSTERMIAASAPSDAKLVDRTWEKVNKDGSPDKRFANNRQLGVYEFEHLSLSSAQGLRLEFQFSKPGCAEQFAEALHARGSH
jgi:hypothetical protein